MPKNVSTAMQTHLDGEVTTLATLLRLVRDDGAVYGFTSLDTDITFDGVIYEAAAGFIPTSLSVASGLNVDSIDISSILAADQIVELDLMAGLFDHCVGDLFQLNYTNLADGVVYLAKGWISGEVEIEDHQFTMELRSKSQKLKQTITKVYTPLCNAKFGDEQCLLPISTDYMESGIITDVTSNRVFADSGRTETDDHFAYGVLTLIKSEVTGVRFDVPVTNPSFETGDLTGWTTVDGSWTLRTDFDWNNRVPDDGTYMILASSIGVNKIEQEIDLVSGVGLSGSNIDAEIYTLQLYISQCSNHLVEYFGHINIVFKDIVGADISTFSSESVAPLDWRTISLPVRIPIGARFAVLQMESEVLGIAGSTSSTVFFDNVKAVVYETRQAFGYSMEVKEYDFASKTFTLFMALPFEIEVDDQYTLTWGCDKIFETCRDRYDNALNFRGFPHIPDTNVLLGKSQLSYEGDGNLG